MPRFRAKPIELEAFQLRTAIAVPGGRGRAAQHGKAGDWLVTHPDNRQEILTDAVLQRDYELVHENDDRNPGGGGPEKPSARRRPGPRATRPKPKGEASRHSKLTHEQWATARVQWDAGVSSDQIGRRLKISGAGILYHAKTHGWPKRAKRRLPRTAQSTTSAGEQLGGRVHCNHCGLMTEYDPCEHCHKKLKRTWS